ncbi:MAG: PilT/PilU family type 4a pilus ATPase [Thermoanaerobaculia bacterium]|nr:PilT/PilU family type 4a pilus ATPase [Thermoanaerobaculia bacterium]
MDLNRLLTIMTKQGASDLHLKPMRPPLLRLNGRLLPLKTDPLKIEDLNEMVDKILTPAQKHRLEERMSVDLGYGVPGVARFRGNIFVQRGNLAACFRRIPYEIKTLEDLDLPKVLLEFCQLPMGLVLVTGPTGSGKSTTLAAIIKYIAANRPVHVITVEDPIEFLFGDAVASISQREIGTDTFAYSEALRNAMRQDPDVIMVGEMRDPETIGTALTAAETGHLVFSTLHTNSSTQTVDRILDSFPADQQGQIRTQLAQVLKGVVSMKLVPRRDGQGRVAALEIMRASPKISKMIEKGETSELLEEVEASVGYYRMQTMNQSLLSLLVHNEITYDEAMAQSADPEDLSLKLRKMFPNIEGKKGTEMATSDFAEIQELRQFRKLYEEQEVKQKEMLAEKDEEIEHVRRIVSEREQAIHEQDARIQEMKQEVERMRGDYARLRDEAQQKIDKLMDRIRELNQRLTGGAAPPPADKKAGIFR